MLKKLRLKEAVIVEGRYDRIKLCELIASPVIETGGFRVFKDKEKQRLISRIAQKRGILILTDSDAAGFVIRNFLKGIIPLENIKNGYVPEIIGKEKRKPAPSKEGLLGVEGMELAVLREAIKKSGATILGEEPPENRTMISKSDLYDLGLSGRENSKILREELLSSLGLPKYLSTNALVDALNCLYTKEEFEAYMNTVGKGLDPSDN
ncbi:MAG: DUF4093 domain-containing protein [Ruminococcus sp.]|nr:DUF4093 domain-containing protein [Ruminococcus sp.]